MTEELAEPVAAGIDPVKLDLLLRRVRWEVETGPLPSAQVAVAKDNRLVAFETYGAAAPSSRYVLQSVSRPVVASVMWRLIGEGRIDPQATVTSYVPEFGTNGKDVVTVEHVLTHTAGFPMAPLGYPRMLDRQERLAAFAKWRLDYEPGTRMVFHLTSAAWVIAELTERVTGQPIGDYLAAEVAGPLGVNLGLGVPVERQGDVAFPEPINVPPGTTVEVDPWGPWFPTRPEILAAGEPSHSMVGSARDVALFYQGLLHSDVWKPEWVEEGSRIRVTLPVEGDYGTGPAPSNIARFVVVAGDDECSRGFLPTTGSARTFGSGGAPCQVSFLDPESGLSFAFLTNGYPVEGYDFTRAGINRRTTIANLAADVVAR